MLRLLAPEIVDEIEALRAVETKVNRADLLPQHLRPHSEVHLQVADAEEDYRRELDELRVRCSCFYFMARVIIEPR